MLRKKITGALILGLLLLLTPGLPAAAAEVAATSAAATFTPTPASIAIATAVPNPAPVPAAAMTFTFGDTVIQVDPQEIASEVLAAAGDNVVRFNGDVVIRPDEVIQGNVVAMNSNIEVRGRVLGNVTAMNGDVTLRSGSFVGGNVTVMRGDVVRENGAQVQGRLTFADEMRNHSGTYYASPWWYHISESGYREPGFGGKLAGWLLFLLGLIALTAVAVALFPAKMVAMKEDLVANPGRNLGVGFLGWVALPVVMLALVLTIIGIPVAIAVALALSLVVLTGLVAMGLIVGERVERALGRKWPGLGGQTQLVQAMAGVGLLWLVQTLPVVGWLIWVLAAVAGMGVILGTRFGTNRPWFGGKPPAGTAMGGQVNGKPGAGEIIDIPPASPGAMPDSGRENS